MPDASFLPWQELNGQIFVPRAPETWNSQTRTASQVAMNQTSQRQDIVNICPTYVNMLDRKWMSMIEIDSWIWTITKNFYIGIAFLTHPNQCQSQEQNWVFWNHLTRRSKMGKTKNLETTWNNHEETGGRFMLFLEFGHAFCILIDSLRSWVYFPDTCDSLHGQSAFPVVLVQDVWTHRVPSLETMTTMCNMLNARTTVNESADLFKMVTQSLFHSEAEAAWCRWGGELSFILEDHHEHQPCYPLQFRCERP